MRWIPRQLADRVSMGPRATRAARRSECAGCLEPPGTDRKAAAMTDRVRSRRTRREMSLSTVACRASKWVPGVSEFDRDSEGRARVGIAQGCTQCHSMIP
jgi:hypothetical protein